MNLAKSLPLLAAGLMVAGSVSAQDVYQPMPSVANPYVGHGGNGLGRIRQLNDLELTAISRATESIEVQMAKATAARTALTVASLAERPNPSDLQAKAQALADSEVPLALARAEAYAKLRVDLKATTPAKAQAIQAALNSTATGRGGGGNPAPAGAAAGGRAGAAAPAGRGN